MTQRAAALSEVAQHGSRKFRNVTRKRKAGKQGQGRKRTRQTLTDWDRAGGWKQQADKARVKLIGRQARGGSGGGVLRGGLGRVAQRVESVSDRRKRRQHQRAGLGSAAGARRRGDLHKGSEHGGIGQDSARHFTWRAAMAVVSRLIGQSLGFTRLSLGR